MSLSQGKYRPTIAVIDEVDDHNFKPDELQKLQIEGSETSPLTAKQEKANLDDKIVGKDIESQEDGRTRSSNRDGTPNSNGNGSVNGIRGRLSIDALMNLSRKRRFLYIATACLCAVLLVIIILMIAFWPDVPFYLRAELCLEKECVEAGRQILLWANTSKRPCQETYEWACGNFENEFADHDYYVIKRGEWNYKTYNEFQELNELNRFISMLPTSGVSYSVESTILSLYRSCREIDTLDKSQSDLLLKKAIQSVDGWHAFRGTNRLQDWKYKKALVFLQAIYGIFPYYKISVENRFNKPHDYIIAIDEGDIGLPDKYFYNIDQNDEIVRGYKLLLRDFAINMGIVSREAELFADEVFHYEKRIVNHIDLVRESNEQQLNEIRTLGELKSIAPSLPIFDSLIAVFPHTKITEETEILVRNVDILHEISTVVSTSDKKPINDFIVWSMARHLLPHLSKEYRTLVENFDHSIYGRTATYPRWMICTKIVKDWLPFAVDALKERQETEIKRDYRKVSHFPNKTYANDEMLQLMVHNLRNQLQSSIDEADWIDRDVKNYIKEKLTTLRLQIGIPREALIDKSYIRSYYHELLLNNIFFVDHLESIWSFRKSRMENKLKAMDMIETIISELYTRDEPQSVTYSIILNMLIISRGITVSNYFDYRYPIAVNFARIGADILEALIDSLPVFIAQFNAERRSLEGGRELVELAKVDVDCLVADATEQHTTDLADLSESALKSFRITLSAAKIAARALSSFINAVDSSSPIPGASVSPDLNYENLRLTDRKRVPGLRSFGDNELFTLAYMQKHCSASIAEKDYARIKSHVEQRLPERYLFNATWNHIQFLKRSSSCSVPEVRCSNIL